MSDWLSYDIMAGDDDEDDTDEVFVNAGVQWHVGRFSTKDFEMIDQKPRAVEEYERRMRDMEANTRKTVPAPPPPQIPRPKVNASEVHEIPLWLYVMVTVIVVTIIYAALGLLKII